MCIYLIIFVLRGAKYDVLLRIENRRFWNNMLLNYMNILNDTFVVPLVMKYTRPKADRLDVILKHYTPELLHIVMTLYAKDIELFEYQEDVSILEEIINRHEVMKSSKAM